MSASDETPVHRKPARRGESAPRWFGEMGQAEFEVDFYERVLARHPNYVIVLRALGEQLARKGMYARSLEVDRRLVSLVPHDCVARYNLACSLAMQGAPRQAIEELSRAIEYGYDDFGHLEVDPDLDSLRKLPAYQELMRQHGLES
jgi:tetratricopeptide (TPR) repeat protein